MSNSDPGYERSIQHRIRLAAMAIMAIVACTGFFVLYPEYSHASRALLEVDRLELESGAINLTESRLDSLRTERDHRLGIERDQLREIPSVVSEAYISDALALKVDDGGATSWSIRQLPIESLTDQSNTKQLKTLPVVVEMEGRFGFVLEALNRVESSNRLIRVRTLRVRKTSETSDQVEANFEIDTVFATGI